MITAQEINERAAVVALAPHVVEKDYVLGLLLHGVSSHPALSDSWVFKGGTCLKKCHFETYRFSEDLDFTLRNPAHLDESFLRATFAEIAERIYNEFGIEIPKDRIRFTKYENPRGGISFEGRIYYRGPLPVGGRENYPRIKLDLLADEPLMLDPVVMQVRHDFTDVPSGGIHILCYAYEEICAEKLRALCERSRARDLYDVVHLYRHRERRPDSTTFLEIVTKKFERHALPAPSVAILKDPSIREELQATWEGMLGHQLPFLPPFGSFWDALPEIFEWVAGAHEPVVLPSLEALEPRESVQAPTPPSLGPSRSVAALPIDPPAVVGPPVFASFMEMIRFAGANRLCIDLRYNGTLRRIEPYSLRRSKAGAVLLHAVRRDSREPRAYRLDRIQSVTIAGEVFQPQYEIELTEAGYQAIPQYPSRATHVRPARRPGKVASGPTYQYRCFACGRLFEHHTQSSTLQPHKDRSRRPCYGRAGGYVGMKY